MRSMLLILALCLPLRAGRLPLAAQAAQSDKWSQASYVWDSEALLDPGQRPAELEALRKAGMDKIYLGLKAAQINDLVTTRQQLGAIAAGSGGRGVASEPVARRSGLDRAASNAISSPIYWRNSKDLPSPVCTWTWKSSSWACPFRISA